MLRWVQTVAIETAFIDPGKPWQNGTDESFNGKFRNECLTLEWFRNRLEAKVGIERWRRHYNEERPHMSLGDQTPAEFKSQIKSQSGCLGEAQRAPFSSNDWSEETGQVKPAPRRSKATTMGWEPSASRSAPARASRSWSRKKHLSSIDSTATTSHLTRAKASCLSDVE